MGITHFDVVQANAFIGGFSPLMFTGTHFWVDPANGSDGNTGLQPDQAFATLYKLHAAMTAGKNDVGFLVGDGSTTGTARLSKTLAQGVDSSATTGVLNWSKDACHLVGVTAPAYNQRARIAPPSGTYTAATFGSGNFVNVSASGCYFANFSLFHGFSTGGAAQICWTDSGSRNYYSTIHFGGMGDTASGNDAGSRVIKLTGAESIFERCFIGLDTVTRSAANYSVEFSGSSCKRHSFIDCFFPFFGDDATVGGITVNAAAGSDRWQRFVRCGFFNAIGSTSTTMNAIAVLPASIGGLIVFDNCWRVGITDWASDATGLAQCYVIGPAEGATDDIGRGSVAIAT